MSTIDTFLASLERDFGQQGKGKPFEVFCKWFLEHALITATEARDSEMVNRLDAVAGRLLNSC